MDYEKDIFAVFAYEFEPSQKFKSSAKRIPLLFHYYLLLAKKRQEVLVKSEKVKTTKSNVVLRKVTGCVFSLVEIVL